MAPSFISPFTSGIFCYRGYEKTVGNENSEGNVARIAPTAGQGLSFVRNTAAQFGAKNVNSIYHATGGTSIGRGAEAAIDAFESLKKSGGIAGTAMGTVDFVSKHTNHFIGLAALYNIATADKEDRERTIVSEGAGFGAMLTGENLIKSTIFKAGAGAESGAVAKILINTLKVAVPQARVAALVLESLAFAGVSIGSWMGAAKVAENIYDKSTGRPPEGEDKDIEKRAKELEKEALAGEVPQKEQAKEIDMDEILGKESPDEEDLLKEQAEKEKMEAELLKLSVETKRAENVDIDT